MPETASIPAVAAHPWRIDEPCPYPLNEREHLKFNPPPGQTIDCILVGWVHTSSMHAYPVTLAKGTWAECETRRVAANFPQSLRTYQAEDRPKAY